MLYQFKAHHLHLKWMQCDCDRFLHLGVGSEYSNGCWRAVAVMVLPGSVADLFEFLAQLRLILRLGTSRTMPEELLILSFLVATMNFLIGPWSPGSGSLQSSSTFSSSSVLIIQFIQHTIHIHTHTLIATDLLTHTHTFLSSKGIYKSNISDIWILRPGKGFNAFKQLSWAILLLLLFVLLVPLSFSTVFLFFHSVFPLLVIIRIVLHCCCFFFFFFVAVHY